jgi:hypothetical protein
MQRLQTKGVRSNEAQNILHKMIQKRGKMSIYDIVYEDDIVYDIQK